MIIYNKGDWLELQFSEVQRASLKKQTALDLRPAARIGDNRAQSWVSGALLAEKVEFPLVGGENMRSQKLE